MRIPCQDFTQRAVFVYVVTPNALQGQIESVSNLFCATTRLVDRPFPVYLVSWEDHHPANRVADGVEGFQFLDRDQALDVGVPPECRDHRIAI